MKMTCKFCNKEFDVNNDKDMDTYLEHMKSCWNVEQKRKEQEEIARRKEEELKRVQKEMDDEGEAITKLIGEIINRINTYKKNCSHIKGYEKWNSLEDCIRLDKKVDNVNRRFNASGEQWNCKHADKSKDYDVNRAFGKPDDGDNNCKHDYVGKRVGVKSVDDGRVLSGWDEDCLRELIRIMYNS